VKRVHDQSTDLPENMEQQRLRGLFIGESGLRAGWRLLLFYALFFALGFGVIFVRHIVAPHTFQPGAFTASFVLVQEVIFLIVLMVAVAIMVKVERRPFALDFLPLNRSASRQFATGLIFGFVAISTLILGMWRLGTLSFDNSALHGLQAAKFAILWGVAFVLVGLFEESSMRGYAQATLWQGVGFWPAAVITSLLFAALHASNAGESVLGIASVFCVALFFCLSLWRTGTLWFAVGCHAAWDYGETFFYGVPDSGTVASGHLLNIHMHGNHWITGGSVGPEGSILVFIVYGLLTIALLWFYPAPSNAPRLVLPGVEPRGEVQV
jgi:CAAX protease family protein